MRILPSPARLIRVAALVVVAVCAFAVAHAVGVASASTIDIWGHDHSSDVITPRPDGLAEIPATFGPVCGDNSNGGGSYSPAPDASGPGYVYSDPYIGKNVGGNIRGHVQFDHKDDAVRYLVGGYNCRYISGTTEWSLHAWGAAIDTNSATNPVGKDHWNAIGPDARKNGTNLPAAWAGPYPGPKS